METVGALPTAASVDVGLRPAVVPATPPSLRAAVMLAHPTLAVAVTERGSLRSVNAAWRSLFAMRGDVSVEAHVATLFTNGHADRVERLLQSGFVASVDKSTPSATIEHAVVRRDGKTFAAEILVWLFDATGVDRPFAADAIWQIRDITAEREAHRDLRDLRDYYRELSRHQWDMTLVVDRKGRMSYASPSIGTTLGYDVNTLIGEPFRMLLDPQHAQAAGQWLRTATTRRNKDREEPEEDAYRLHVLDHAGRTRVLACRPRNCFDVPGIVGMVVHARDVTASIADEEKARIAKVRADALRDALVALGAAEPAAARPRIEALLAAAHERLDLHVAVYRPAEADGPVLRAPGSVDPLPPLASGPTRVAWQAIVDVRASETLGNDALAAFEAAHVGAVVEIPVVVAGALRGWLVGAAALSRAWADADIDFLIALGQLAALALAVDRIDEPADAVPLGDRLTGLPDRVAARRWLDERVAGLATDATLTMLSIDLDRLQDVNEHHGQDVGDAVIVNAARVLVDSVGEDAYVARVGGDAFVVVLMNATAPAVDEMVATLLDRIGEVSAVDSDLPRIDASIGGARLPADAPDAATLWLHCELAKREAKARGRGQSFFFNPRLAADMDVRHALEVEISDALAHNEFRLFYQPQVALATGKVMGLEALLRWQHPTRGLVLPNVFLDAAVERGLIDAITKWVLGQVCEQIEAWRRAGDFPDLPVSVNVAGSQFHDRRLPAQVASALLRSGLPARLLVLDLTERTLIDDDPETQRVVRELDRLGIRTSVGGFALGHGALKQLRQLRVGQIKLDRGFVETLPDDEASAVVVGTMIDVARKLKCQVIAEGVETREQFDRLRELGCEAGQGFFFGAPLSPEEIHAFIEGNRHNPIL